MPAELNMIMLGGYACRFTGFDWSAVTLVCKHSVLLAFTMVNAEGWPPFDVSYSRWQYIE
jgi:hypothetical protein